MSEHTFKFPTFLTHFLSRGCQPMTYGIKFAVWGERNSGANSQSCDVTTSVSHNLNQIMWENNSHCCGRRAQSTMQKFRLPPFIKSRLLIYVRIWQPWVVEYWDSRFRVALLTSSFMSSWEKKKKIAENILQFWSSNSKCAAPPIFCLFRCFQRLRRSLKKSAAILLKKEMEEARIH